MGRRPRKISESGLYHIILRGINKQINFESEDDRYQLLSTLKRLIDINKYILFFDTQKPIETVQNCLNNSI